MRGKGGPVSAFWSACGNEENCNGWSGTVCGKEERYDGWSAAAAAVSRRYVSRVTK
jgi:hypothetical protein